ncbi:MAG TPA: NfeD family protein [Bacillota bacterium]|jgi:membrane protein implicated in regulation of membrane protease activity|nr:NfeD family protein [Candidatus Izemoplasmatales bacterium]HQN74878.1 NfeD family protein [Bacillota bacterium]
MFLAIDPANTMIFIWFAIIIFAGVTEALTMDLSSIWFAVGGFFALIIAIFWPEMIWLQALVFILFSTALLLVLRPIFKRYVKKNEIKTNADSLIGKTATCVKPIIDGERGEVKIEGKIWTAIANEDIQEHEKVVILAIKGVKLVVRKE